MRKLQAKLYWVKNIFQKSKFSISLGSQSCTSRLFNSFLALPVPLTRFPGCFQKDRCTYSACVLENHSCLSTLQCLPDLTSVCSSSGWGSPKHLPGLIWEGTSCSSPRTKQLTLGEDILADMVFKYRLKWSGTNAAPVIQIFRHCLFMASSPFGVYRRLQPMLQVTGREQSSRPVFNHIDLIRSRKLCVKTLEKPTQLLSP